MSVITLDPTNGPENPARAFAMAERPETLQGQILGIIANGLGDSEMLFDALGELYLESDHLAGVVKVVKHSVAVPPEPEQWQAITEQATVVITGFGGCGSCSTRSMRDALDLEAAGIPAVCVVHEALVPAVQALSRLVGAPDYPIVVASYPHDPTGHWTKEEAANLAARLADAVKERLVR